jgi:hypothetical protein
MRRHKRVPWNGEPMRVMRNAHERWRPLPSASSRNVMKRSSRSRRRPVQLSEQRLAELENALRGANTQLSPEWAAEALAKSREGRRLLIRLIDSQESSKLRRAAIYGLVSGKLSSSEFNLLLRTFENSSEEPSTRGQAAEALGPRVTFNGPRRHLRRRDLVARFAFERGLDDPAPEVRFWSIFALARPGNDWLIPKLETMAKDKAMIPGMWTVGQEASWAMHWIRGEDVDPKSL